MGRTRLQTDSISIPESPTYIQETLDSVVGVISNGTVKIANVPWFDSASTFDTEISPVKAAPCRCDFWWSGSDAKISFTLDGIKYAFLHEGITLKKDSLFSIPFGAEDSTEFNIKASENVIVEKCVISIIGKQELPAT